MISFEHRRQPHVLSLIIAFFGGILTVLVLQNAGMGGYLRAPAATIIRKRMMENVYVGWPRYTENRCRNGI